MELNEIINTINDKTMRSIDDEVLFLTERYHPALDALMEHLGIQKLSELPYGYSRSGSGTSETILNSLKIKYQWSKWKGDTPCSIIHVEMIT